MIKSKDENQFVYNLLKNTSGVRDGWIGLYRKADNKFYWLDGRPAKGHFQKWNDGEPSDSGGNEDCVNLYGGNFDGKWNDQVCSYTGNAAICQWPI